MMIRAALCIPTAVLAGAPAAAGVVETAEIAPAADGVMSEQLKRLQAHLGALDEAPGVRRTADTIIIRHRAEPLDDPSLRSCRA